MKKTYIEPKNTVVRINLGTLIAQSPTGDVVAKPGGTPIDNPGNFGGREVIQQDIKTPDAWEEW